MKLSNFKLKPIVVKHTGWKSLTPEVLNPEVIVARAGTKVVCPKCLTLIGRIRSDLFSGVSCRADQIEFERLQKRHPREAAECRICQTGYMVQHMSVRNGTKINVHVEVAPGVYRWI